MSRNSPQMVEAAAGDSFLAIHGRDNSRISER